MTETTAKFIIQELTSWPIITIAIVLLLLKPIRGIVSGINNIKVGDFQVSLQKIGESLGVPTSVLDISNLNYDDLKIFLIICGEDADYYYFRPGNMIAGKFKQILDHLADNGLITLFDTPPPADAANTDDPNAAAATQAAQQGPTFGINTTEKGRKVHRALLDSIYEQLLHVKTVPSK